jgi:ribonuclease HII
MASPLLEYDLQFLSATEKIVGIDEAGRGALAGPVVAAAVALGGDFYNSVWCQQRSGEVNDSKQLSVSKRDALYAQMTQLKERREISYAVGISSVAEVEQLNVFGATKLAMERALEKLENLMDGVTFERHQSDAPLFEQPLETDSFHGTTRVLIDGIPLKGFAFRHQAIVHGDGLSLAIAMASIIAKVTRDRIMDGLDMRFPCYGFSEHKGYATRKHRDAIREIGPSPEHRPSFLKKLNAGGEPMMEFVLDPDDKIS